MRKCAKCGKEYPDQIVFCVSCGSKLPPIADTTTKSSSNKKLIIVIIILSLLIAASVTTVIIILNSSKSGNETIVNEVQTVADQDAAEVEQPEENAGTDDQQLSDEGSDQAIVETDNQEDVSEETVEASEDVGTYQSYFDSADNVFGKLILSGEQSGRFTAFYEGLESALESQDGDACRYNYEKLVDLEKEARKTSASAIKKLKKKFSKLTSKSSASKAKKKVAYIKAKTLAKSAEKTKDYRKAKKNYDKCIKMLQAATKSGNNGGKTNDSRYRTNIQDDTTYYTLYSRELSSTEVNSLNADEKRYYINTLFAAYGYRFSNPTIQGFFDNQNWYSPDYTYDVGDQEGVRRAFNEFAEANYKKLTGIR